MKRYGYAIMVLDEEYEAMRKNGYEPEQHLDRKAIEKLMKEATEDGAVEFNKKYSIEITKQKDRELIVYGSTRYKYEMRIEEQ